MIGKRIDLESVRLLYFFRNLRKKASLKTIWQGQIRD
jgi:hypothetical protein